MGIALVSTGAWTNSWTIGFGQERTVAGFCGCTNRRVLAHTVCWQSACFGCWQTRGRNPFLESSAILERQRPYSPWGGNLWQWSQGAWLGVWGRREFPADKGSSVAHSTGCRWAFETRKDVREAAGTIDRSHHLCQSWEAWDALHLWGVLHLHAEALQWLCSCVEKCSARAWIVVPTIPLDSPKSQ